MLFYLYLSAINTALMDSIIEYFSSISPVKGAFYATVFTWLLTAFGASFVFLFKTMNRGFLDGMLGFTGGVMDRVKQR